MNGFLVSMDVEALYRKQLERLLADEGLRCVFTERARERVREFSHETALAMFEGLILGTNM